MDMKTSFEVRVYPIDEPMGSTLGFASVSIGGLAAIRGVRVVQGEHEPFVSMPKVKDKKGNYHEIASPLNDDLRKEIYDAVLAEYEKQSFLPLEDRAYEDTDKDTRFIKNAEDVKHKLDIFIPIDPKGSTQAYVNIVLDDIVSIRSARIVNGEKGLFLSMPQSKDNKTGDFKDIAFPLSGDVRKAISKEALEIFAQRVAERDSKKQGIGEKIAAGVEKAMQYSAAAPTRAPAAAKSSPGLGD